MKILFISSHYTHSSGSAPFVKKEYNALRDLGLDIDLYAYSGGWSMVNYANHLYKIYRLIKTKKYDILHARFGQCGVLAIFFKDTKSIVTFGGSDLTGTKTIFFLKNFVLTRLSRFVANKCDKVILVSSSLKKYIKNNNYSIIPSGVNIKIFKPIDKNLARDKLSLSLDKKYILFVGNPKNKIKQFHIIKELCSNLQSLNSGFDVELLIVNGKKDYEVSLYMNSADCLVLTSLHEGSPNVVKEAIACELPIVSFDVGDVRAHIRHFKECFLVNKKSQRVPLLFDYTKKVLSKNERINGGFKYVKNNISTDIMAEKINNIYTEILK